MSSDVVVIGWAGVDQFRQPLSPYRQVLGDEAVELHAKHISLEVPTIDRPTQVVCNTPNRLVQFRTLSLL